MTLSDTVTGVTVSTWGRFDVDEVEYQRWSVRSGQPRFFIDLPHDVETLAVLSYAVAVVRAMEEPRAV